MIFCVQNIVLDALFLEQRAQGLGFFNGNGADQHRLTLCVALGNVVDDGVELCSFGLVDDIIHILTDDRLVGGDLNNVKIIYLSELGLLGHGGTRHTRKLGIKTEEILEGNGGQSS